MAKLTVEYLPEDNDTALYSDGDMEDFIRQVVTNAAKENATLLRTSQESAIGYVRLCILEGLISHEDVEFIFGDKMMFADKYGHLDWWPTGFCDYNDNLLNRLLQGMFKINGDK